MPSDLDTLLDMGFDKPKAELAVQRTGGLQGALEWLEAIQDKSHEEIVAAPATSANAEDDPIADPPALQPGEAARSLVCNVCGKKFRSHAQAEFHASKTQHVDFAESTEEIAPLTEEEKKARLEELRQKLAEKRAGTSEQDKIDQKRNEEIRRKSTKETQDIKEELKKKEQLKEAAAKRKEKQDEIDAKARIKAKIAADKEERRLRAEKDKAEREGRAVPVAAQASPAPTVMGPVESKPASAYTEARLRLQTSAENLQKTFPVTTTLFEVAAVITQETGSEVQSFTLNYPKKVYDAVDFGASLKELGLVPSASLIVKVGDQHRAASAADNPFEDVKPHVNEYTAQEIATLSSRLEKKLGPEYISTRPGASGQKVPYLAGDKCINLANEVFGFNGWSSGIQQIQIDFVEESQSTGRVSLGLSVIVRVTLRDGTYHEDLGYGHIENCKGKAAAFEKAKKQGTTDALKRALRNFGNILGNCFHDRDYMSKVTRMQVAPAKWDPENLHRHPDYVPAKKEIVVGQSYDIAQIKRERPLEQDISRSEATVTCGSGEPEDEFSTDDFDEVDFSVSHEFNPADLSLEQPTHVNGRASTSSNLNPILSRAGQDGTTNHEAQDHAVSSDGNDSSSGYQQQQRPPHHSVPQHHAARQINNPQPQQTPVKHNPEALGPKEHPPAQNGPLNGKPPLAQSTNANIDPPVGFFTARAAETIQNCPGIPLKVPSFNLHLESPSIRKTAGVDHSKTKPVGRDLVGAPLQTPAAVNPASRSSNFVNPQADKTRRLGMPVGAVSPLSNRNSYKPPQLKRPAEGINLAQQSRPALGDVTATTVNVPSNDVGGDLKRQRTGETVPQGAG
ncbi:MAG: hypothetical protein Q9201_002752 [Fulgogasparrea decipioides]